jgi:alkylhydroperoxidase family enzyme
MRTSTPRLPPLTDQDELDDEQQALATRFRTGGGDYGIARTFLRHPRMFRAYNAFATHTFSPDNTLTRRESEIVTMRAVWQARAGYQWSRHIPMGLRAGLSEAEIEALKQPVGQGSWSDSEAALIASVDALMADFHIPDDLWARLAAHYDDQQCIDILFLTGRYAMAAMFTNTAGTPIDAEVKADPDLDMRGK